MHSEPPPRSADRDARRLHPVAALFGVARALGSLVPLLIVALLTERRGPSLGWMLPVFLALVLVEGIGGWWRFRYWVEHGEFRIERGFLVRRRSFVPLDRIHAVDVSAGVVQRLFGLVRLELQTASADEKLELSAISETEAERLRALLSPGNAPARSAEPPPEKTYRLSLHELLLLATTSGQLGVMFSALAGLYSRLDDVIDERVVRYLQRELPAASEALRPGAWLMLIAAGLVLTWLLSVLVEIGRFGGFSVTRRGDDLIIERGLLERRQVVIPVRHVQAILLSEGLLRQPFGYASILIESAAHAEERGRSSALHPFVHRSRWRSLLSELVPEVEYPAHALRPPRRAATGFVIRPVLGALILCAAIMVTVHAAPWLLLAALPAAWLGWLRFRDSAAAIEGRALLLRWRGLARTTALVPQQRVQYAGLSQSVLQRRRDLVSFEIGTAGANGPRRFAVRHLDAEHAATLLTLCHPARGRSSRS